MGLAASQARLLLLTAKNDALELQAQKIENERLILAQEQETIAQEYTDKTSNEITTCRVTNPDGTTTQETMTLASLAKSVSGGGTTAQSVIVADANGEPIIKATAGKNDKNEWEMNYQVQFGDEMIDYVEPNKVQSTYGSKYNATELSKLESIMKKYKSTIETMNTNGSGTVFQNGIENGSYQLWLQDTADTANVDSTSLQVSSVGANGDVKDEFYVRKNIDALATTTTRYYTEDDAAAQAAYDTAMAKVNALDTRLENKLNQVETQKKAVEQEMESVDSIIQSNIERTFQYFS